MDNYRRINSIFDSMIEDVKYSKIAAFTKTFQTLEEGKKETV